MIERILRAKRDFERDNGRKPERVVIHYEGWNEIINDEQSKYMFNDMMPPLRFMGMAVIRTADIGRDKFVVF